MKTFHVSETDFEVLLTVYKLLDRGVRKNEEAINRCSIVDHSNLSRQKLSYRIKNSYLLEKQLKENIA